MSRERDRAAWVQTSARSSHCPQLVLNCGTVHSHMISQKNDKHCSELSLILITWCSESRNPSNHLHSSKQYSQNTLDFTTFITKV